MRLLPNTDVHVHVHVLALALGASLLTFGSACGRTDLSDALGIVGPDASTADAPGNGPDAQPDVIVRGPDGTIIDANRGDRTPPPVDAPQDTSTCGNGKCDDGESCTTCPGDCGFCKTCGDGTCNENETCSSCPQDCGSCSTCGDGFCRDGETCLSCPADCEVCPSCGDGTCSGTENCTNCPSDCGACAGCGDGHCSSTETCVSCPDDCGSCAVCGNGVCNDGETCINCAQDCGTCALKDCEQVLTCVIGCLSGGGGGGGMFNLTCITDCDAEACPSAQTFTNSAVSCAVESFIDGTCSFGGGMGSGGGGGGGGGALSCIESACSSQVAACFAEGACRAPIDAGTLPP